MITLFYILLFTYRSFDVTYTERVHMCGGIYRNMEITKNVLFDATNSNCRKLLAGLDDIAGK